VDVYEWALDLREMYEDIILNDCAVVYPLADVID